MGTNPTCRDRDPLEDESPVADLALAIDGEVDSLETHVSRLHFTATRVYKVKKAVKFAFLDASSLERRKFLCEEEVRLGRRLAGDVYRGVVPITRDRDGRPRIGGDGEVVEYAVEMLRLPADRMLDHALAEGRVDNALLTRLVDRLARFEGEAARGPEIDRHAAPDVLERLVNTNLDELAAAAAKAHPEVLPDDRRALLASRFAAWFARDRSLLRERVEAGRIREGHGDLHAGNVCDLGDRIVVYDAIEFDPALRCLDPAAEIAFLAMDIETRGYPGFAAWLVKLAARRFADPELPRLVPLYAAHYALVRAKVALLKGGAAAEAARYVDVATLRLLPPVVLITCGLPGSGKSTFAAAMAARSGFTLVRSDVVRKRLSGMAPSDRSREGDQAGIYTPSISDATYDALLEQARLAIGSGRGVIVDAAFPTRARRERFAELARAAGALHFAAHVTAEERIVRERLARRASDPFEASDADFTVYRAAVQRFEAPGGSPGDAAVVVDAAQPVDAQVHAFLAGAATLLARV
jgi:aminoglycoside phosphotransferase family enzyme/predicted kinase